MTIAELGRAVARIENKVDKALDDHEFRLRGLERWRYAIPASVIGALGAVFAALLTR